MWIDIPWCPWVLFASNALMNFKISSVLESKVESLFSVSNVRFVGRELLLTIVLHCLLKKSLNKLVFAKKQVDYPLIVAVLGESWNRLQKFLRLILYVLASSLGLSFFAR